MTAMQTFALRRPYATLMSMTIVTAGYATGVVRADGPGYPYVNEEIGVSLTLPGKDWELYDHSQGIAKVLVFSTEPKLTTRCSVLYLPTSVLPGGLDMREGQIKGLLGDKYKLVSLGKATFAGREADRLEYAVKGTTTIEWGFPDGAFYVIFQLSAPDEGWQDPATKHLLEGIRDSFKLGTGTTLAVPGADLSTPAEIREKRRRSLKRGERAFQVTAHHVTVRIDPTAHSLSARDHLTVKSAKDGMAEVKLYYSHVTVDGVSGPPGLKWDTKPYEKAEGDGTRQIVVRLSEPLGKGQEKSLLVETSSSDFLHSYDQKLVAEVAVLGQVRENSSYSSHVAYYPVDEDNDAAVDLSLIVPSGYTAVTGGEFVGATDENGWTSFRYKTEQHRHRILPFGFAVAKYLSKSAESHGGLRLTVYGYPGEELEVRQRVKVAVESANVFEKMMGPLPWKDVRFAHVTPVRKETGVSLPGLVLISDMFFGDLSVVDLSDGQLNKRDGLSLLVVADELSHQWNAYSVPLPNELAEGISTFTNALFIEHRHGREGYRNAIKYCRDAYLASTKLARDVAIADPAIYQTEAYRGIAFCKTPVVLDMLRTRIGDDMFFAAWRNAFRRFDTRQDGFDVLQEAFTSASGVDMGPFFDQWFFTAGRPKIGMTYSKSGGKLSVALQQVQEGAPYRLKSELLVRGASGQARRYPVTLNSTETVIDLECPFEPVEVVFDPEDHLLKEMVED